MKVREKTKRFKPKVAVLRELYLKSGNECAYPGCNERMVQSNGTFVGQVCHIEAAMQDGPRFNPNQTNEERRIYDDLVLMCYKHHKQTDNEKEYNVDRLMKLKTAHESKFECIVEKMKQSIRDYIRNQTARYPKTLEEINKFLEWGFNQDELLTMIPEINEWINKLIILTLDTRKVFSIMLDRCRGDYKKVVPLDEVQLVTQMNDPDLSTHYEILSHYGFISEAYKNEDYNYSYTCDLNEWRSILVLEGYREKLDTNPELTY